MNHESIIQPRGVVPFATFTGERVYMRQFFKADGLPMDLARWQPTVDAMLDGIETDQPIYLMIDQARVVAGMSHRRPGLHVDGYWNPGIYAHGGTAPRHSERPAKDAPSPGHRSTPRHSSGAASWNTATFETPEGIILASDLSAAQGYVGTFSGFIGEMGDCSGIDVSDMAVLPLQAGRAYAGNVTALHESLPVAVDCLRTVVRLNVPGWTP